jgi:hypothetical protein
VRYSQRGVANLPRLFAEDCAKQSFLSCELGFALGCNLTDKNIARVNLCADTDDTVLVEVCKVFVTDVGNISCDLLRSELGFPCLDIVFLNMN